MGAAQLLFVGCLCFVSATLAANLLEPEFLSPATMWRTVGTNPQLATSPFYTNEMAIGHLVHQLLTIQQDDKALLFMKNVIATEKAWRFQLCLKMFGSTPCVTKRLDARPFFIWRRQAMQNLLEDPTAEIIDRIRSNIDRQLEEP